MRTKQLIVSMAAVAALIQTASSSKLHAAAKPNIVIIFIDDMGYGDIGLFGASRETPHLVKRGCCPRADHRPDCRVARTELSADRLLQACGQLGRLWTPGEER